MRLAFRRKHPFRTLCPEARMSSRWFQVSFTEAKIDVAANPIRSGSRKRTKESIFAVRHLYLGFDIDGEARLTSLRSGPPMYFPRRSHSSLHRPARIRLFGGLIPLRSRCRKVRLNWSPSPSAEIPCAPISTRSPSCVVSQLQVRPGVSGHSRIPWRFHLEFQ